MNKELETAERIAREAGALLLDYYDDTTQVRHKGAGEPVTEADHASNELIVRRLEDAFPDDAIVAEESAVAEAARSARRIWCVDPLDGTKEFIAHNGEFCVMIGLVIDGRPALGVVYRPTDDLLYRATVDGPAERVQVGDARALAVSAVDKPATMRLVVSRSHRDGVFARMQEALGIEHRRISGSVGLKAGLVAEGSCDLYLHPSRGTKLWDTCAPEAIVVAAGGRMTTFDGEPLGYDPDRIEHLRGLLVSNGIAHDRVLEQVRSLFPPAIK